MFCSDKMSHTLRHYSKNKSGHQSSEHYLFFFVKNAQLSIYFDIQNFLRSPDNICNEKKSRGHESSLPPQSQVVNSLTGDIREIINNVQYFH